MSTQEKTVSTAVSTVIVTDTPNAYIDPAQARLQELRLMREQIPRFTIPDSSKAPGRLNAAASVSADFIERTVVAVANQNALVRGDSLSPIEIRDLMRYAEAYGPVADELEAFAQFVRYSVNLARNRAGFEALTTYSLAKRLAKRRDYAGLVPYVADMHRALGRGRQVSPETVAKREAAKAARAATRAANAAAKVPSRPAT